MLMAMSSLKSVSARAVFAIFAMACSSLVARGQQSCTVVQIAEAVSPGGIGRFCVDDNVRTQKVCAPPGSKIFKHNEIVLARDNVLGTYQIAEVSGDCVEVRFFFHSQDHRQLPLGREWQCSPARMLVRVELDVCPKEQQR